MTDSFLQHFQAIEDPRIDRCKRHELLDIILLAVSAVLSGAEGWEQIEDFGTHRLDWLRRYRPFEYGIPRHDTIARVICRLKPEEIETAFQSWGFVRVERPSYLGRTLSEPDVRNYRIRLPNKQASPRHFQ